MFRFLRKLKSYCRNKLYLEGSIAEGYLAEECMTFCSRYLEDVETRLNRPSRNVGLNDPNFAETYLFQSYGEPIGKVEIVELDERSWVQAHRFVLFHHDSIEPLREDLFDMGNGSKDDIVERSETLPFPEQNLNENIPSTTESGGTRRGRGRTLLEDLYDLNPVERVKVSRNSHGQPVGSEAQLLAGNVGIIARNANMFPINYESWHHMPDSNKNQALDNIKDRKRVGTSSRQKQKFTHMAGSRSFASIAEAEEVSSGQKVGCLQLFEITHRKKDGSPMTSETGEIMEKLKEKKVEYEAIASTDSSVNLENIDNRIITEVLGPERLRDQIAQMKASTVEQIAKFETKYEELQQQLRADAAAREAVWQQRGRQRQQQW
ncbi:hypothetical protein PVK06_001595 [Gossypium arboreum]|uniref:DUF4218 domain-containing protein n=1 Tax=Gossypium arboreum TaxID=29729 RepID=A0ABR0R1I4_GOSAR|nr:hypothetical protein PVK06_001595 [Gossypium arboreum]